jgi:DnaJ-class molecular chaperone
LEREEGLTAMTMTEAHTTCPGCSGTGEVYMHVHSSLPGQSGYRMGHCSTCCGSGTVSVVRRVRMAEGARRREDRKVRNLSLREEAKRLGITAKELADIEAGRVES